MEEREDLVTVDEASRILGVGRHTLYRLLGEGWPGTPTARKVGRRRRYDLRELIAWLRRKWYIVPRENLAYALRVSSKVLDDVVEKAGEPPSIEVDGERLYSVWAVRRWALAACGKPPDLRGTLSDRYG